MATQNTFCVIMAGGIGSRFWPLSKENRPKQFLDILGTGKTLIQQTYERILPLCPQENFYVVTNIEYKQTVLDQLPNLSPQQILTEPTRRNTAPCIAFANAHIKRKNPNALIIVAPSDHLITNEDVFRHNISDGLKFVEKEKALLTLGIKPHRPETGYGYIQITHDNQDNPVNFHPVKTFTEKPNLELAKVFFESGEFFWNSGIFIWSLNSIQDAFQKFLPDMHDLFENYSLAINTPDENKILSDTFLTCNSISIDYGIMEKAHNVYVQTVNFGWSDLGTWTSLFEHSQKDHNNNAIVSGKVLLYQSKDTVVHLPENKIAVIQGLENYIVVESEEALLICPKQNEQQIRQFVTDVKTELL
ncbi:mannose-1-phosphate guanylyltransferase [Breznakibacter xylanolyticus]|uniref:mannose-1-phosphate guanylyltransferase n=1 Tax=Breznakibacter xylanolyticus TaxID=990 RepID=A0A2W7NXK6_9BACT|nr:mannose-1-phosphate guanylyltransferase [Breznakibacter xylanolyticus]MBN2743183.1 mannose-1-phosphate guanylyltransferase [Marinilabiliaceae bacterium]PZX15932.1 mannose-1-phosphate guanylyltransferase [Breznakibacter xylanolyticus]